MEQVYGGLALAVRPEGQVITGMLTQVPLVYCEARGQELPARAPLAKTHESPALREMTFSSS